MRALSGYGVEPALIDPQLPIGMYGDGDDMGYWPCYSEISPSSRGAYLRWLAGGRCDPNANIGLVFLYFYGLERRVLAEKEHVTAIEVEQIRSEVIRLHGIYRHSSSFRRYAECFLGVLRSMTFDTAILALVEPEVSRSGEIASLPLKVGLGLMSSSGQAIPAKWALAWARFSGALPERTVISRCPNEFEQLFAVRYRQAFGDGLKVRPNKTLINALYQPASASFGGPVQISLPQIPDITVLQRPTGQIVQIAQQCIEDLDPYSRFVGRYPDSIDSLHSLALLPEVLIENSEHPALARIVKWIHSLRFSDGIAVVPYQELRRALPPESETDISKRAAVAISQCLARLGFGIEPDVRFGPHSITVDGEVAIFPLPSNSPTAPSPSYISAALLAHLGAVVAHADDQVTVEEEEALMSHAAQNLELSPAERVRLKAHTKWLLRTPPQKTGLKKRIDLLPESARAALGVFLSRLVGFDGHIAPSEISTLQKFYKQLGLDPQSVFTDTHAAATASVTVQRADAPAGYTIPKPVPIPGKELRVDMARVRIMEVESERVSVLLRDIFAGNSEERNEVAESEGTRSDESTGILGLDAHHSRFVIALLKCDQWPRSEVESLAARYCLMPDGAIDTVNEAALDLHGEPLVEGDDPIEVNRELRSIVQA